MDNFEGIIRTLLEADHFWVQSSFKVELTPEERRHSGKHSMPRPELDLLSTSSKTRFLLSRQNHSLIHPRRED